MYDALLKVSSGFKLVYYGLMIVVLAAVIGVLGACILGAGVAAAAKQGGAAPPQGGMAAIMVLMLLVGGMAMCGSIVGLVGRFKCMAVPERLGAAKSMIITSVALELAGLVISVINTADNAGGNFIPANVKMVGSGGSMICSIVAAILFLLFTRSLAQYIRRRALAETAMSVLWLWVGAAGCYAIGIGVVLVGALAGGAAQQQGGAPGAGAGGALGGACVGGVLMLAALVFALVALIKYARLLIAMSDAVRAYARRNRDSLEDDEEYEDEYEVEEEEDERPRRRRREEDYDDEDNEPDRSRGRRRYDDEEEDDTDRPRKKR